MTADLPPGGNGVTTILEKKRVSYTVTLEAHEELMDREHRSVLLSV